MTTLTNWNANMLNRYRDALALGHHDSECEQRERYGLCGCRKRRRLTHGPTEPPMLWYQSPLCSHCMQGVTHDGDSWVCSRCHVSWGSNDFDEAGTFDDDPGDLTASTEERWGRRMLDLAREAGGA